MNSYTYRPRQLFSLKKYAKNKNNSLTVSQPEKLRYGYGYYYFVHMRRNKTVELYYLNISYLRQSSLPNHALSVTTWRHFQSMENDLTWEDKWGI